MSRSDKMNDQKLMEAIFLVGARELITSLY